MEYMEVGEEYILDNIEIAKIGKIIEINNGNKFYFIFLIYTFK